MPVFRTKLVIILKVPSLREYLRSIWLSNLYYNFHVLHCELQITHYINKWVYSKNVLKTTNRKLRKISSFGILVLLVLLYWCSVTNSLIAEMLTVFFCKVYQFLSCLSMSLFVTQICTSAPLNAVRHYRFSYGKPFVAKFNNIYQC